MKHRKEVGVTILGVKNETKIDFENYTFSKVLFIVDGYRRTRSACHRTALLYSFKLTVLRRDFV